MREKTIKELIEKIFQERGIKVNKIILFLFGSRAKGKHRKESDWDLLIIINQELSREKKLEISHLIRRGLAERFIPCDVLIKSEKEVEKRKEVIGSIIKTAIKEGVVL
ncbi:MAG: nucleotidyltransferase domain-containing protein [Candidatus Hydrothermales bacterium]